MAEAAERLGVKRAAAYLWAREARASRRVDGEAKRGPTFARLVPSGHEAPSITVRVGGVAIEVREGFDRALLAAVVDAVRGGVA